MCKPAAVSILWKTRSRLLNLQSELNKLILANNRSITLKRITKHRTKEFRFVKLQKKKKPTTTTTFESAWSHGIFRIIARFNNWKILNTNGAIELVDFSHWSPRLTCSVSKLQTDAHDTYGSSFITGSTDSCTNYDQICFLCWLIFNIVNENSSCKPCWVSLANT